MNAFPDAGYWLRTLGGLGLHVTVVFAVAAAVASRLPTARAQRAVWLTGFVAVGLSLLMTATGLDRRWAAGLGRAAAADRGFRLRTGGIATAGAERPSAATATARAMTAGRSDPGSEGAEAIAAPAPCRWPGWVWLAGVLGVGGRRLLARGLFTWWWRRRSASVPASLEAEVRRLARRFGMRRQVRVVELPGLAGPVAFGTWRPTIGLPAGFVGEHSAREREAMLAHEVAHLRAHDALGLGFAEGVVALVWWVPTVWWARRKLRAVCEGAADESSQRLEDGPATLAACLLALAAHLPKHRTPGWLGMAGFRSDLGRRVERLLALGAGTQAGRRSGGGLWVTAALGVVVFTTGLGLAASGWATADRGEPSLTMLALAQEALRSSRAADGGEGEVGEATPGFVLPDPVPAGVNAVNAVGAEALAISPAGGGLVDRPRPDPQPTAPDEAPSQVVIEARFVEITQEAGKPLGLMPLLQNLPPRDPGETGTVNTATGVLSDPQFRDLMQALDANRSATNGVREWPGDQLAWPGSGTTNAASLRVASCSNPAVKGLLTEVQYAAVLQALQQGVGFLGVDILSAPRVTTLSGLQAQIQVVDLQPILTGINPAARVQPGVGAPTNALPFLSSVVPVGPTLDVIPQVGADGRTISLTVLPTVTEFLGYDPAVANAGGTGDGKVRVWENGKVKSVAVPLPRFRVRQLPTQAELKDGQTLVLGGVPIEETRTLKDKVPVLGDLPLAGRLFRSESQQKVQKTLLVFVTATRIDARGNRVKPAGTGE